MEHLIDTHCHFEPEDNVPALLAEAHANAVYVLAVGGSAALNATALASGAPCALGYDWSWGEATPPPPPTRQLRQVAVGELGFDLHYAHGPEVEARQIATFLPQAAFAKAQALPVIVHTREADTLTLEALREAALPRAGVIHSFTGTDWAFAKALLDLGYAISFSGILTFRNASALREIARRIPDDRLLMETDSPYLAPVPFRGERNRPVRVRATADCLAQVRGVAPEHLAHLTTENALRLFGPTLLENA